MCFWFPTIISPTRSQIKAFKIGCRGCVVLQLPINGLVAEVGPEDHLLVEVCVQGHRVPLLLHNLRVLLPLQAQAPDVSAVGEDQARLFPCGQETTGFVQRQDNTSFHQHVTGRSQDDISSSMTAAEPLSPLSEIQSHRLQD